LGGEVKAFAEVADFVLRERHRELARRTHAEIIGEARLIVFGELRLQFRIRRVGPLDVFQDIEIAG